MPQTFLAFDYGTKNIGVAAGQSITGTGSELAPLRARDGTPDWGEIEALIKEWRPAQVLVGLPLNMDGSPSDFAGRARKFGQRLHGRFGVEVEMVDERLSTFEAKGEVMARGGSRDYKNNPVDSIAARLILESWLRERPAAP